MLNIGEGEGGSFADRAGANMKRRKRVEANGGLKSMMAGEERLL
jgi:hypothetical protein